MFEIPKIDVDACPHIIPTGLVQFDEIKRGIPRGQFLALGALARTGYGKSMIASVSRDPKTHELLVRMKHRVPEHGDACIVDEVPQKIKEEGWDG